MSKKKVFILTLLCFMTIVAAILRLIWLDHLPPGLYHDEAYNGLDALAIGAEHHPIYFEANTGREPLYIYLMSLTVRVLGRTPTGIRAISGFLGALLIPLTFLLGKEMFDERIGLWAASLAVAHLWLLCLSRTGFRSVTLPVISAAGLAALWRGRNSLRYRWFALAGLLLGLTQYTYLAARFVPIALALCLLLTRRRWLSLHSDLISDLNPGAAHFTQFLGSLKKLFPIRHLCVFAICALLINIPLIIYALNHPQVFMGRAASVTILSPQVHQGDFIQLLGDQIARHSKALFLAGDPKPRHNVPGKPMLNPITSLLFIVGLSAGLSDKKKRAGLAFTAGWIATMFLPGLLSKGGPGFLRLSGVLPLILIPPAIGADWLIRWISRRLTSPKRKWCGFAAVWFLAITIAMIGVGNVSTYYAYYSQSKKASYHFEVPSTEIAASINQFLGRGYTRGDLLAIPPPSDLPRRAYVSDTLLRFSKTVTFLLQPDPRIHRLGELTNDGAGEEERLLMIVPGEEGAYFSFLPPGQQISVHVGSEMQDERRGSPLFQPHLLFVTTRPPDLPVMARFEAHIALLDYKVNRPTPERLEVTFRWQADDGIPERDYTVFVHLLEKGILISQHDGLTGQDHYSTSLWRENDVVVDVHQLTIPNSFNLQEGTLRVGFYRPEDMTRLSCSIKGQQKQDSLLLPVVTEEVD